MSDNKHGQGAQWSKGAVAATAAAQKLQQQQQQHLQNTPAYNATVADAASSILYGGTGHLVGTHHAGTAGLTSYASARFQAPPVDHRSATSPSSHIVPPTPTPSSTTNVPAPSGFIPPPFSPATAAATSVLTPNPYAVSSLSASGSAHTNTNHLPSHVHSHVPPNQQFSGSHPIPSSSHHGHFGMEQFQHLNIQQQYELSKLMAASFSTTQQSVSSSGPTNLSSNTTSSSTSAYTSSTAATNVAPSGTSGNQASTVTRHPPTTTSLSSAESSTSGAINSQMADQVISAISSGTLATKLATTPIHGRLMGLGVHAPDEEKLRRIQQVVESSIGEHAKQQIVQILDRISNLRPVEKLLLYLRLPGEQPETDPLRQPQNPLGTRSEINHTINWVRTHLEQDPQVSIPKQDVYNDYLVYCDRLDIKPLSTADFGKVMKQVFPGIRPRRLGTRGHSRYCYAAMRKTSKLPAPHLPTVTSVKTTKIGEKDGSIDLSTSITDSTEEQEESWSIVKQWAETTLHVKIDNITELASHIKTNGSISISGGTLTPYTGISRNTSSSVTHKKHTQREPKEKRVMADMGPLKKRRKKKRKGSSSSESTCQPNISMGDQLQMPSQLSPANSSKSGSQHAVLSPGMEDDHKLKIKQEIMDSPGYPHSVGSLSTHSQSTDSTIVNQYQATAVGSAVNTLQMSQLQVMPMNLAAETRGGVPNVLIRNPSMTGSLSASAFEHVRPSVVTTPTTPLAAAVKNLTPKIMELSTEKQAVSSPTSQTVIKQEVGVDDYNTSNIFCKKVRKAQQTKGFWSNLPTTNRYTGTEPVGANTINNYPVITTTASTPPPVPASLITAPPNNADSVVVYNMGPPTQMAPSTSPNNQTLNEDASTLSQPKVLSRNLQQLKAKKLIAAAATASCDPPDLSAAKDAADLPENLGLPRERVISICNMDKHELDDYFLPVEEENSEDQETELLQYFQMGDAEEKLTKNSSSDAKRNSNSTVNHLTSAATSTTTATTNMITSTITSTTTTGSMVSAMTTSRTLTGLMTSAYKSSNVASSINDMVTNKQNGCKSLQSLSKEFQNTTTTTTSSLVKLPLIVTTLSSSSFTNTVITASASLAQLTQKHLQQQKQPQAHSKVSIKRKINVNTTTSTSSSDITAARKNYSFLPISPNINTPSSSASSCNNTSSSTSFSLKNNNSCNNPNVGFFASPGVSRLLTKQQSLDSDTSSDPMIGATRRQRTYNSIMTSASAPPSPSVLKQQRQQEQQMFGHMTNNILVDQWSHSVGPFNNPSASANVENSLMVDQNSLDLDLFGEAAAAAASTATNVSFGSRNSFMINVNNNSEELMGHIGENLGGQINDVAQRSQSVPLSQLQRSHSPTFNRAFHSGTNNPITISACNSLAQTPVPSEFIDSVTMLSENSCSQQSVSIKLEEVANVVGSDSTAILDEVDVSEILSSPDFMAKFSNVNQVGTIKTNCSSVGSSSGYSSAGHFSLSSGSYSMGGCGNRGGSGAISSSISRSVPSTPLPHQNPQNAFGTSNNFYRRRFVNHCQTLNGGCASGVLENLNSFSHDFSTGRKYGYGNNSSSLSRSACDISKSMPSTPITTTPSSFRYSPSEFTRDFLINGNTIDDSITSSLGGVGSDNLIGSDVMGVDTPLNSESLLNDEDTLINGSSTMTHVDSGGVLTPDFAVQNDTSAAGLCAVVGESSVVIGVGSDLLDNL